jgi:hypothetical protein
LFIEGNPELTYALVRNNGVEGKNIVSQMFDPYFYMTEDPYKNWAENRMVIFNWLKENKIRTIVTYAQVERYIKLANIEKEYFSDSLSVPGSNIIIYQVDDKKISQDF